MKDDFTGGLKDMFFVGGLCAPVRLTPKAKKIILEIIADRRSRTSWTFDDEEDNPPYERFMLATMYLEERLTGKRATMTKPIAIGLYSFVIDNKYYWTDSEKDFKIAMQWITNQWNKKYSQGSLIDENE